MRVLVAQSGDDHDGVIIGGTILLQRVQNTSLDIVVLACMLQLARIMSDILSIYGQTW